MKHTKKEFKKQLKEMSYKQTLELYNIYQNKYVEYKSIIAKDKTLYPVQRNTAKMETMTIVKYKLNLIKQKLNNITIQNG